MGLISSFVLGYHGTDANLGRRLVSGEEQLRASENEYDWLGHGVYFWEANPQRGLDWARKRAGADPDVVGAVIELGNCLDLLSAGGIEAVKLAFESLRESLSCAGEPMPRNHGGKDRLRRALDCAVIEHLHQIRRDGGLAGYDTVRGMFREGPPIYPDAGFFAQSHIQICVRTPDCIKAVFRVPPGQVT